MGYQQVTCRTNPDSWSWITSVQTGLCKMLVLRPNLADWDVADDSRDKHAKWHPTCGFLLATKGTDFVNQVVPVTP